MAKKALRCYLKNLSCEVIYPPKEVDEHTKRLSETLGYKTVKVKSKGISTSKQVTRRVVG